ncbi:MAG: TRAM domain-containing protein, partial [Halanaerobiales bacterium]|nr:TRAM domain-containing protein [Halanaerobiales bacterium]
IKKKIDQLSIKKILLILFSLLLGVLLSYSMSKFILLSFFSEKTIVSININRLANALKPVLLPGEKKKVEIIKRGKEQGQGIAYLKDGTMIVVEGGQNHIGEKINVVISSFFQKNSGRMYFANLSSKNI